MPTLVLIRHARAEPNRDDDLNRALVARGREDAARLQGWLLGRDLTPDRVVLSPSARTRETWQVAAPALSEVVEDRRLYEGGTEQLKAVIAETPSSTEVLAMVGHNPTIEQLLAGLVPDTGGMSPCDAAVITVDDWQLSRPRLAALFTATA